MSVIRASAVASANESLPGFGSGRNMGLWQVFFPSPSQSTLPPPSPPPKKKTKKACRRQFEQLTNELIFAHKCQCNMISKLVLV